MKKNVLFIIFTTFLLMFISVAYAAFNSDLIITGEGIVETDTIAPTCGAWYLRDSSLTIQEAYNQNKFINPGTNTTWTNTDKKLFIECSDNMPGSYGCINVTEITDSNNQKRYFKEVKEYNTSIQTDPNVVSVTLQDAYLNSKTCTLPVGGSNPYLDKQAPELTITRSAANKFTYSATDDIGVQGYMVTTTSTTPAINDPNWVSEPSEVTIDNNAEHTYYVWVKDGVNITSEKIDTYLLTKSQGTGTTLTLKYNNSSGVELSTGYVLDGTVIYVSADVSTGYSNLEIKKNNVSINNPSTHTISAATTIESSADHSALTVTFDPNGGTVSPTSKSVTISSPYGLLPVPIRQGYEFMGWTTLDDAYEELEYLEGTGTQYILTDIYPNVNNKIEADIYLNSYSGETSFIGTRASSTGLAFESLYSSGVPYLYISSNLIGGGNSAYNQKIHYEASFSNSGSSLKTSSNGEYNSSVRYSGPASTPYMIYAYNANGTPNFYFRGRIYDLKIYDDNVLTHHFIPSRRKSDNVLGLRDIITGTFYTNSGSGTFVAGPSKVITSDTIVYKTTNHTLIAVWESLARTVTFNPNGGTVSPTSKTVYIGDTYGSLPTPTKTGYTFNGWVDFNSQYKQLEYLESTGTQYILTDIIPTSDNRVVADVYMSSTYSSESAFLGAKDSSTGVGIEYYFSGGTPYFWTSASGSLGGGSSAYNQVVHYDEYNSLSGISFETDTNGIYSSSSVYNGTGNVTPYTLFAYNKNGSATYLFRGRIYDLKIYESGSLAHSLIPVKRISDNVLGFYDEITGSFYTNSGSGTFNAGQEINPNTITSATTVTRRDNHTLYATWSPNTYTINFDKNASDAAGTMPAQIITYDNSTPLTQNAFIRVGYSFNGWNTQPNGSGTAYTDQQSVLNLATSGIINLYAQWIFDSTPTISVTDFNTFSFSGGSAYFVSTTQTTAPAAGSTAASSTFALDEWTTATSTGDLTLAVGQTYYVWVKNDTTGGDVSLNYATIQVRTITRNQGSGTTLTTKFDSSSGTEFTDQTKYVLNGINVYATVSANTGYHDELLNVTGSSISSNIISITNNVTISTSATAYIYTITLDNQSGTTAGTTTIYEKYGTGYYMDSAATNQMTTQDYSITKPTKDGKVFRGYFTEPNGQGDKYIDENGFLTTTASATHFTANGTLYAYYIKLKASDLCYTPPTGVDCDNAQCMIDYLYVIHEYNDLDIEANQNISATSKGIYIKIDGKLYQFKINDYSNSLTLARSLYGNDNCVQLTDNDGYRCTSSSTYLTLLSNGYVDGFDNDTGRGCDVNSSGSINCNK